VLHEDLGAGAHACADDADEGSCPHIHKTCGAGRIGGEQGQQ
jgi:hypothetical protein